MKFKKSAGWIALLVFILTILVVVPVAVMLLKKSKENYEPLKTAQHAKNPVRVSPGSNVSSGCNLQLESKAPLESGASVPAIPGIKGPFETKGPLETKDPLGSSAPWDPEVGCPGGLCPGLGEGFDLRHTNALNDPKLFLSGRKIFAEINLNKCAGHSAGGLNSRSLQTASSTNDLVRKVASDMSITGSFPIKTATVTPSITANTGYDATSHSDIKSSFLDLVVESGNVYFYNNDECRGLANVSAAFLADFRSLPVEVADSTSPSSWSPFGFFFEKWGTHVIGQITYGSRLQQWESTLGTSDSIDRTLQIKACVGIEGTGKSYTAQACASFSDEEKRTAAQTKTNSNTVIIGGSEETRRMLQSGSYSADDVNAFLESSNSSNQGVKVQFIPIWVVLGSYLSLACGTTGASSEPCADLQRALNLEAAFAFSATDCRLMRATNGVTYQAFVKNKDSSGLTTYACWNKKLGCSNSDDCHYSSGAAGCKSYGSSAIQQGQSFGDPADGLFRSAVRGGASGSIWDGINNSCTYHAFKGCECDAGWSGGLPDRFLWQQGS